MLETAILITAAIVIPALTFVANWALRAKLGYALSAASDFALSLVSFDLAVLTTSDTFVQVVRSDVLRTHFHAAIVILLCLTFMAWMTILLRAEYAMVETFDVVRRTYPRGRPMVWFLSAWAIVAMSLCAHILVFTYT